MGRFKELLEWIQTEKDAKRLLKWVYDNYYDESIDVSEIIEADIVESMFGVRVPNCTRGMVAERRREMVSGLVLLASWIFMWLAAISLSLSTDKFLLQHDKVVDVENGVWVYIVKGVGEIHIDRKRVKECK